MIEAQTQHNCNIRIPVCVNGYEIMNDIGKGGSSVIFKVKKIATKEIYAAKIISKSYAHTVQLVKQIEKEVSIMNQISHPNIVKYYESFEIINDINESYIIIIMEYCENGNLWNFMKTKDFQYHKNKIIKEFLEAIQYLHNKGIAHCDIKLDNIVIDSNFNAKLSDFGYSQTEPICSDELKFGTLLYAPPELFIKGDFWTFKADIWEVGITLYCISEGDFPYNVTDKNSIIEQIITHNLKFKSSLPEGLKKIIEKCTNMRIEKRPTISEIIKDEYFPWNHECNNETSCHDKFDLLKLNRKNKKRNTNSVCIFKDEAIIYNFDNIIYV